jgi:Glycosyl hydrolase family 79, N-terminal domain
MCVIDKPGRKHLPWLLPALLAALPCLGAPAANPSVSPASMAAIGSVDERFQSYNIEMVEVTGGRFWKPYSSSGFEPHTDRFEYRRPIDLDNPLLRKLAAALGPAYLRVSGSWANATYFSGSDGPSAPPPGFDGVLSRQQWRGVIDFAQAVGAEIVTSFAVSPGTRDAAGVWSADQAHRLLAFTHAIGGRVAAAEFMNEPNVALTAAPPASDDVTSYARDFRVFHAFMKENFPDALILGPGTAGEVASASELLRASGPGSVDAISYHYYGTVSERCSGSSAPEDALSEEQLTGTERSLAFYRQLRDRFAPAKPIWVTETAEAACGGNRWDVTFLDTFRYLDQLARLAAAGVQVVMHNTLAASDYGLIDEGSLAPRPNFWGALLWRHLMGRIVLDPGVAIQPKLHVYAQCQRGVRGGVSLLIINLDHAPHSLDLPVASERYTLHAASAPNAPLLLNDISLHLGADNDFPPIAGVRVTAGALTFAPSTITFLGIPEAANQSCQ